MSLTLFGLGTAVPPGQLTQDEALLCAKALGSPELNASTLLSTVYAHSGIRTRAQVLGRALVDDLVNGTRLSASPFLPVSENGRAKHGPSTGDRMRIYAQEAPGLAIEASRSALAESGITPESLTHLVTVSCTGFYTPGVDHTLIRAFGLRPTIERVHVGFMGCHGAINGLRTAAAFAGADPNARVLLCAVELCSLHYHYGAEPDRVVANALFADGAAAVVGAGSAHAASDDSWRVRATGSCLIPDTTDLMSWTIGDGGFEMTLSRRVPAMITRHLKPWLESWLGSRGFGLKDIGSWAIHPGGPKIMGAVGEGLGLPEAAIEPSRTVFEQCGNMSSPTVLFIVDRLRREGASRPCVALGFGPGLTAEAALFA